MARHRPPKGTFPGVRYQDKLAAMEPEEREQWLQERAKKKELNKLMSVKLEAKAEEITAQLMRVAQSALDKAEETGDAKDFMYLYNTIVGKPIDQLNITSNGNPLVMNVITQEPSIVLDGEIEDVEGAPVSTEGDDKDV